MAQVKATFHLPIKDNDGRELVTEIEEVRAELYLRFGGWTYLGPVQGSWRMASGMESRDDSQAYALILDDSRLPELEQVLRTFKSKTTQEAVYFEIDRDIEIHFLK